jgi:trigger factor
MHTRMEEVDPCRKTLNVSVEWAEVAPEYDRLLGLYAAAAQVPGFRKGKAPAAVVERRFARDLTEETKERLVPRFYRAVIAAEKLKPVAVVQVTDVALVRNQSFSFRVTVDLPPVFKLPKYQKVVLKDQTRPVADEDVDRALESLLTQLARYEDVQGRKSRETDLVQIDYRGEIDGRPITELSPDCSGLGAATDFWAQVGQPEILPGFAEGLRDLEVGETRVLKVAFPGDYQVAAVAGKSATYTLALKAIRQRVLPAMDEAFFKSVGVDSEEQLRGRIRDQMHASAERDETARRREEVSKFLVEKTEMDPPRSLVEEETRHVFYSMVRGMIRQGVPRETMEQQRAGIAARAGVIGGERVRLRFILEAIAAQERIEVRDEDFERALAQMAEQRQMSVEALRAELTRRDELERVRTDVLCDRTMAALVAAALGRG